MHLNILRQAFRCLSSLADDVQIARWNFQTVHQSWFPSFRHSALKQIQDVALLTTHTRRSLIYCGLGLVSLAKQTFCSCPLK